MRQKPASLDALTSLRFFAAASIVLFHIQGPILHVRSTPFLALGVSFFFVLSGFILAYVYQGGVDLKKFYLARFARLWPVHAATLVLTIWLLVPHLLTRPEWTLPLIANATLLHAWVPVTGYVFSFNGVSWSISTELFFYLLFPLLMGRMIAPAIGVIAALTIAALFAISSVSAEPVLWQFSPVHFVLQHPVMRVLEFAVGVAAGRLFVRRRMTTGTAIEVVALAAVFAFALASAYSPATNAGRWFSQSGGMLIFAAAIYIFAHEKGRISRLLQGGAIVYLGKISFSTYMIHQIILKLTVKHELIPQIGISATFILYIGSVYLASALLFELIEKPGRKWILSSRGRRFVTDPAE